jgi:hypothetical protein
MEAVNGRVPELDINLFAETGLKDPFDNYSRFRDAGSLVRLVRPAVYAIAVSDSGGELSPVWRPILSLSNNRKRDRSS